MVGWCFGGVAVEMRDGVMGINYGLGVFCWACLVLLIS